MAKSEVGTDFWTVSVVKPIEMDFGPARASDEQDLSNALATENLEREPEKNESKTWIKRVQYMYGIWIDDREIHNIISRNFAL
jgi:hypothetical protein